MAIRDLPDMYAQSPRAAGPRAEGIHIRQIPHGSYNKLTFLNQISRQMLIGIPVVSATTSAYDWNIDKQLARNFCIFIRITSINKLI